MLLQALDFIARLCALIPPPRFHMLRYHGVFAGHSSDRAEVVVGGLDDDPHPNQLRLFSLGSGAPLTPPPPSRHPWAWLLRRVFAIDIMTCPRCEARLKVVTLATEPDSIRAVMAHLPPTRAPPRPAQRRQLQLIFAAA